jgi:hypothetical protein
MHSDTSSPDDPAKTPEVTLGEWLRTYRMRYPPRMYQVTYDRNNYLAFFGTYQEIEAARIALQTCIRYGLPCARIEEVSG